MRAGLLVTGVLGAGTALVFAAAAATATMFPNGTVVTTQWNGGWGRCFDCGWEGGPLPMPLPVPMPGGFVEGDVFIEGDPAVDAILDTVSRDVMVVDGAVPAP